MRTEGDPWRVEQTVSNTWIQPYFTRNLFLSFANRHTKRRPTAIVQRNPLNFSAMKFNGFLIEFEYQLSSKKKNEHFLLIFHYLFKSTVSNDMFQSNSFAWFISKWRAKIIIPNTITCNNCSEFQSSALAAFLPLATIDTTRSRALISCKSVYMI